LALKRFKKRLYLAVAKSLGLYHDVIWQASTVYEAADIRRWFGDHVPVIVASNLPAQVPGVNGQMSRREKVAGHLKIVFLSRISRMKNLDGALTMLQGLKGEIQFNIYGPLEAKDQDYWAECQKKISLLPPNIKVKYWGGVEYSQVAAIMREHDLFFLPTLGENFGHVILDALHSGCPVLISDKTPWRDLEAKGVGWVFPLSEPDRFRRVIEACIEMGPQEHARLSAAARSFAREIAQDQSVIQQNRNLFECALSKLPAAAIQY
jgi:glycosyltransferase involved in cell wall biosynthesis